MGLSLLGLVLLAVLAAGRPCLLVAAAAQTPVASSASVVDHCPRCCPDDSAPTTPDHASNAPCCERLQASSLDSPVKLPAPDLHSVGAPGSEPWADLLAAFARFVGRPENTASRTIDPGKHRAAIFQDIVLRRCLRGNAPPSLA